jgi:hypothetical protein
VIGNRARADDRHRDFDQVRAHREDDACGTRRCLDNREVTVNLRPAATVEKRLGSITTESAVRVRGVPVVTGAAGI